MHIDYIWKTLFRVNISMWHLLPGRLLPGRHLFPVLDQISKILFILNITKMCHEKFQCPTTFLLSCRGVPQIGDSLCSIKCETYIRLRRIQTSRGILFNYRGTKLSCSPGQKFGNSGSEFLGVYCTYYWNTGITLSVLLNISEYEMSIIRKTHLLNSRVKQPC
jgi:hypothetical protein